MDSNLKESLKKLFTHYKTKMDEEYLKKSGDTMSGNLTMSDCDVIFTTKYTSGGQARGIDFKNQDGTVFGAVGAMGTSGIFNHIYLSAGTDTPWNGNNGLMIYPNNITWKGANVVTEAAGVAKEAITAQNADKLGNIPLRPSSAPYTWPYVPEVGTNGVMEVGKYIDFHTTSDDTSDNCARITADPQGLSVSGLLRGTFVGSLDGTATKADSVTVTSAADNIYRNVWFSNSGDASKVVYATNFQYNPSAGILKVPKVQITTPGNSWLGGKTTAAINASNTPTDGGFYPVLRMPTISGHVATLGTINDSLYIAGYKSDRTTNGIDWGTHWDVATGKLIHSGTIEATSFKGTLEGNAATATKLTTDAGGGTTPVYFSGGKPVALPYTIGKSVPSNAVFTDTWIANSAGSAGYVAKGFGHGWSVWGTGSDGTPAWVNTLRNIRFRGGVVMDMCDTDSDLNSVGDDGGYYTGVAIGTKNNVTAGVAIGNNNKVTSSMTNVAIGASCEVTGSVSCVAIGIGSTSNGSGKSTSVSIGYYCSCRGSFGLSHGSNTQANAYQIAGGHWNDYSLATAATNSGSSTGTLFVLGNGSNGSNSNAFRVLQNGQTLAKGAYSTTGCDYAEYFEWEDGNPNEEDRVGYFVTFSDKAGREDMIVRAQSGDYVLGVVSGLPSVIGNYDECWRKKFEMDEFGRYVYETSIKIDPSSGEEYEEKIYKQNPDYDSDEEYIPRDRRPEWSCIGMLGVLTVYDDGNCVVGEYCKCGEGGIAVPCDSSVSGYKIISRINQQLIKILFR